VRIGEVDEILVNRFSQIVHRHREVSTRPIDIVTDPASILKLAHLWFPPGVDYFDRVDGWSGVEAIPW